MFCFRSFAITYFNRFVLSWLVPTNRDETTWLANLLAPLSWYCEDYQFMNTLVFHWVRFITLILYRIALTNKHFIYLRLLKNLHLFKIKYTHLKNFFIFITGCSKVLGIKRFIFEIPTFVTAVSVQINHEEREFTAWLTAKYRGNHANYIKVKLLSVTCQQFNAVWFIGKKKIFLFVLF